MTNEEAIKWLTSLQNFFKEDSEQYVSLNMAIEALNQNQWIPCEERLPEGDEIVLVNSLPIAPYQIILATAKDVRRYYTKGAVNAWMPLPESYRGNKDGE